MQISIIIPVFNEAPLIRPFLWNLRERTPGAEIIVVDGGSADGTDQLAQGLCDHVIRTGDRSRAKQMNIGADAACGDIFWFLHADAEVPLESLHEIERIMRDPTVCGGFFRIRLPAAPAVYRLTDGFAHYAGLLLGMRCGDHGIFCRRSAFVDAGGFPDVALMEDVEFFRRLRRCGRVVYSNKRIEASPRRYETVGPTRLTFAYGSIATLYLFGVSRSTLARIYRRMCCGPHEQAILPK
ncbi:MAG TPA: TIGR04283 family arsenosugar biosynthesis glycosyltransferase [Candidatus Udaeobacter sp.]